MRPLSVTVGETARGGVGRVPRAVDPLARSAARRTPGPGSAGLASNSGRFSGRRPPHIGDAAEQPGRDRGRRPHGDGRRFAHRGCGVEPDEESSPERCRHGRDGTTDAEGPHRRPAGAPRARLGSRCSSSNPSGVPFPCRPCRALRCTFSGRSSVAVTGRGDCRFSSGGRSVGVAVTPRRRVPCGSGALAVGLFPRSRSSGVAARPSPVRVNAGASGCRRKGCGSAP